MARGQCRASFRDIRIGSEALAVAAASDFAFGDKAPAPQRPVVDPNARYWPLQRLKRAYTSYLQDKQEEIQEQKDSRRYYHGSQWTAGQLAELRRRRQPAMTFNRIARKINGVVGVIERLRQDPKAFPRTPMHEQGAELATSVLRYVLDQQDWRAKSPLVALDGAVDGLGGVEIILEEGDRGDPEVGMDVVDPDAFFYDPRSFRPDFSDATYMGYGKWLTEEQAEDLARQMGEELVGIGSDDLSSDSDRDNRWFSPSDEANHRVRLVDCWYQHQGRWCWALFTGSQILAEGESYLKDEKGKPASKFIMYSAAVDHDGDRYGFIRQMRSAQDSLNAKQSKMQHILASRRLIVRKGAADGMGGVEKMREEWARPDGVIEIPGLSGPLNQDVVTDDQTADFAGWAKMLELALAEMENFGPNPALIGQGGENQSGRAIALLQQAGISELGPYMLAYRGWKVRVYRAIWNMVTEHWQAERYIRVTDDDGLAQFIKLNGLGIDPQTGQPTIVNAIGNLDVDIILDEGPDTITQMQDSYDTLVAMGPNVPPPVLIEMSPLASSVKKKLLGMIEQAQQQAAQQPNPEVMKLEAEMQAKRQDAQLQAAKTQSDIEAKAADVQIKRESAAADMEIEAAKADQQLQIEREKHFAQMQLEQQRHEAQMERDAVKAAVQIETQRQQASQRAAAHAGRQD